MDILARFANENDVLDEADYQKIENETGNVFLPLKGLKYADTINLGFFNFMWVPKITVQGVQIVNN